MNPDVEPTDGRRRTTTVQSSAAGTVKLSRVFLWSAAVLAVVGMVPGAAVTSAEAFCFFDCGGGRDSTAPSVSVADVSQSGTTITVEASVFDGGSGVDSSSVRLHWDPPGFFNGQSASMRALGGGTFEGSFTGEPSESGTLHVSARDDAGNEGSSSTRDYTIEDKDPPSISGCEVTVSGTSATIRASVSDAGSGLDRVILHYTSTSGRHQTTSMSEEFIGTKHKASFSGSSSERFDVHVEARDGTGNSETGCESRVQLEDRRKPSISDIETSVDGQTVTVTAQVSDSGSGVDDSSVVLHWDCGFICFEESKQLFSRGSVYEASFQGDWDESGDVWLTAQDTAGNEQESSRESYSVPENSPPSVREIDVSTEGRTVTVSAEVGDPQGAELDSQSVTLHREPDGFDAPGSSDVPMEETGSGQYQASFQGDWGESGEIWIKARDRAGEQESSSRRSYTLEQNREPSIDAVDIRTHGREVTVSARVQDTQGAELDPSTVTLHRDPADDLIDHPFDEETYAMDAAGSSRYEASFTGKPGEAGNIWVAASDDANAETTSPRQEYQITDNSNPEISDCRVEVSGTTLTVSAKIKDEASGVGDVTLVHRIGGSSGTTPMSKAWVGDLPLIGQFLPHEVTVSGASNEPFDIHVRATDQADNSVTGCSDQGHLADTQPPTVEITRIEDETPPVRVEAEVQDGGVGVKPSSVKLHAPNGLLGDPIPMQGTPDDSFAATFDANVGASGTVRVTASDTAGNEGTSGERTFEVASAASAITGVLPNRVPAETTTSIVPQDQTGTIWGASQGLEAFTRVRIADHEAGEYRVAWSATRNDRSEPAAESSTKPHELESGHHTIRLPMDANALGALEAGTYEFEFELQVETSLLPGSFETVDTASKEIQIRPRSEIPLHEEPREDVDPDPDKEPVIGKVYQGAKLPEPSLKDAFLQTLNVIGAAGGGDCCVIPEVFITSPQEQMDSLVRQTASLNVEAGDGGEVQLSWRNKPVRADGGFAPLSVRYDRALLSATVPSDVTIEDDGGADYRVTGDGKTTLTWITTRVDKGIEPNPLEFGDDPPNQQVTLELGSQQDATVEVDATARLMLGPVRGKVTDIQPFVTPEPLDEIPAVYDYDAWQTNPDEAYWLSLGFASATAEAEFSRGTLAIDVEEADGQPAEGASVTLWRGNYGEELQTRDTDASGTATWEGLETGLYTFEVRKDGFWGAGTVDLEAGGTETTFTRTEPYLADFDSEDEGDGDKNHLVNEPVRVEPEIANPDGGPDRDTRVQILVDADGDGEPDHQTTEGGPETSIPDGGDRLYESEVTPETAGTHRVRVKTEAFVNDRWQQTGDSGWANSFEVVSSVSREPTVTITEVNLEGDGEIVRHETFETRKFVAAADHGSLPEPLDPSSYNPVGGNAEAGPTKDLEQVQDPREYPHTAIVKIHSDLQNGATAKCSGVLVEDNHVLTAAHCVWNRSAGVRATDINAFPGRAFSTVTPHDLSRESALNPFGAIAGSYVQLYQNWLNEGGPGWDTAVVTLEEEVGRYTGTFGYDAFDEKDKYKQNAYTTGYPADPPSGHANTQWEGFQPLGGTWVPALACLDDDVPPFDSRCLDLQVDLRDAMSGGPTWQPGPFSPSHELPYVLGVNSEEADWEVTTDAVPGFQQGDKILEADITSRITPGKYSDIGRMIDRGNEVVDPLSEPDYRDAGSVHHTISPKTAVPGETTLGIEHRVVNLGTDSGGCRDLTYALENGPEGARVPLTTQEVCSVTPFWETRPVEVQTSVPPGEVESGSYELAVDVEGSDTATLAAIEVQAPAQFHVTDPSSNTPIQEGETLHVSATLENDGDVGATEPVSLTVAGQQRASRELQLGAGESRQVELVWDTAVGDAGDYTAEVATPSDSASVGVQVTEDADPQPSISVSPEDPRPGESVTLDGTSSTDDGGIADYRWIVEGSEAGSGPTIEHPFESTGQRSVTLLVTDDAGQSATTTRTVTVESTQVPTPQIRVHDSRPDTAGAVTFDGSGSSDSDGEVQQYAWKIDGSQAGTGSTLAHEFADAGPHTVELTVTDDDGLEATASREVSIAEAKPPVPGFSVTPEEPRPDTTVSFDASSSRDPDGQVATHTWTLDGNHAGTAPTLEHAFEQAGKHTVELAVTDDDGLTASTQQTVTVAENQPPTARMAGLPDDPDPGATVSLDGTGSSDPEGALASHVWFVDGERVGEGPSIETTLEGIGAHEVTLRVLDDVGQTDQASRTVTVAEPSSPVARIELAPTSPRVDEPVTVDGSSSSDPDGEIASWEWSVDGSPAATGPTHETSFAEPGTREIRLTVTDDAGHIDQATRTVTIDTGPPDELLPPPLAVAGEDRRPDPSEVGTAIDLWTRDEAVPGTGGETLTLDQVQEVVDAGAENRQVETVSPQGGGSR